MDRGFRVARIAGVDIEISFSWFFVFVLVAWVLAEGVFPGAYEGWATATYWAVGVAAALLLFFTVLVHEMAHAVVAKRRGLDVPRITLFIFGGVSHMSRNPRTAKEEFLIAVAGPLTSLAIAGVMGVAGLLVTSPEQVRAVLLYLASINTLLAIFNILPGFPLDGGRVLRSIIWGRTNSFRRATRAAGAVGELVAYMIMAVGGLFLLYGVVITGLWFILIGWFLASAARNESQNIDIERVLDRLRARDLMDTEFVTVPYTLPVQRVVDEHLLAEGTRSVMVEQGGSVAGILTVSDLKRLPRDEWAMAPAHRVMTPREKIVTVDVDDNGAEILRKIGEHKVSQMPVLDDGRMVGMLGRRELFERIQLEELLRPAEGGWDEAEGSSAGQDSRTPGG